MEAENSFEEICGWVGFAFTLCFFISSLIPIFNLVKGNIQFEEVPGYYFALNYANNLCWYIYGDFLYSDQIKTVYLIGTFLTFISVFTYLYFELQKNKTDAILNGLIILLGTYTIYITLAIIIDNVDIICQICLGTYILLFFYPFQTIFNVIKHKNYNLIPIYNTWISLFGSISWVIYGYGITEYYVIYPNIIIIILSAIQIILYLIYRKIYPSFDEKTVISTIGIENDDPKKDDNIKNMDEETQPSIARPVKIVENFS